MTAVTPTSTPSPTPTQDAPAAAVRPVLAPRPIVAEAARLFAWVVGASLVGCVLGAAFGAIFAAVTPDSFALLFDMTRDSDDPGLDRAAVRDTAVMLGGAYGVILGGALGALCITLASITAWVRNIAHVLTARPR